MYVLVKGKEIRINEFALETGMRPGEYLALTWSDIDLEKCTATVSKSVAFGLRGGGFEIKEPKTKGSRRTVQFSQQMKDRLLAQKARLSDILADLRRKIRAPLKSPATVVKGVNYEKRKASRKIAQGLLSAYQKNDLVFPSEVGIPKSVGNLNRREFKSIVKKIGLDEKDYSIYSLRHTSISIALAAGVNIKTVSMRAGHKDIVLTLNTYSHVLPNMEAEATAKLAAEFYDSVG